jgi:hypothetical protein
MAHKLLVSNIKGCRIFVLEDVSQRRAWIADTSSVNQVKMPIVIPGALSRSFDPKGDPFEDEAAIFIGPKGMGKSTLLVLKRALIEGAVVDSRKPSKVIKCLPDNDFSEATAFRASRSKSGEIRFESPRELGQYSLQSMWEAVWCFLFASFVVQAHADRIASNRQIGSKVTVDEDKENLSKDTAGIAFDGFNTSVKQTLGLSFKQRLEYSDFWTYLIRIVKAGISEKTLMDQYEEHLLPLMRNAVKASRYCLFLDAIDEQLRDEKGQQLLRAVHHDHVHDDLENVQTQTVQRNYDIWANAQLSLIGVVDKLWHDSDSNVRLYTSMRSEAYHSYRGGQAKGQLSETCRMLEYGDHQLLMIGAVNVFVDLQLHDKYTFNFASPTTDGHTKAIESFFGSQGYAVSPKQKEGWLASIVRQTMGRPREIMLIGSNISLDNCPTFSEMSTEEKFLKLREPGIKILEDFTNFLGVTAWPASFDKHLLPRLKTNVLTSEEIQRIADEFKQVTQDELEHPFCRLYSLGLLGTVEESETGKRVQRFDFSTVEKRGSLNQGLPRNNSPYFLLHPLLSRRVEEVPALARLVKYQPDSGIIIGHMVPWKDPADSVECEMRLDNSLLQISIGDAIVLGKGSALWQADRLNRLNLKDKAAHYRARRFEKIGNRASVFFAVIIYALSKVTSDTVNRAAFDNALLELKEARWIPIYLSKETTGNLNLNASSSSTGQIQKNGIKELGVSPEDGKAIVKGTQSIWENLHVNDWVLREIERHLLESLGRKISFVFSQRDGERYEPKISVFGISSRAITITGFPPSKQLKKVSPKESKI